jgi:hypothetical protein
VFHRREKHHLVPPFLRPVLSRCLLIDEHASLPRRVDPKGSASLVWRNT